jgi:hypothetical protein
VLANLLQEWRQMAAALEGILAPAQPTEP